ncbi:MAG TPA: Holliday junction branch migration protein RuvA [Gammaproteobacteria bacterium]|nr:Holliday junction branch migration protein RuvA [Gammaproteobacteria bacterium]
MIGRLRGTLVDKTPPTMVLDVAGVGYEIEAPMSTFYQLPLDKSAEVVLHTHLVVRDDAHLLFGFASLSERTLFRTLIKINGVGAKMALAILSGMDADEFSRCILAEDATALTRLPGVGKKTAERLIVEMKDKLPEASAAPAMASSPAGLSAAADIPANAAAQASAALESLGYRPAEAAKLVAAVKTEGLSTEDVIRQALKGSLR